MKRYLLSGCLAGAGFITSGCIILDGAPTGEAYERAISPSTSHSDSWEKAGVSEEQKRDDWIACGGKRNGLFDPPYNRKSDGDAGAFFARENRKLQRCLIGKGYRFTGQCIHDMAKTEPACGAP
ncbi:hypothetical protein AB4Y40_11095 [Paraburkholderia sp. EG287B]|uniref:hypothetical protein n=1 Tax=unclassified Paraburkholderia TaxID=2615204 RepID=UPI0034D2589A